MEHEVNEEKAQLEARTAQLEAYVCELASRIYGDGHHMQLQQRHREEQRPVVIKD